MRLYCKTVALKALGAKGCRHTLHCETAINTRFARADSLRISSLAAGVSHAATLDMAAVAKPIRTQRASARMFTHAAAEVRCNGHYGVHVGVLRDISEHGMFIYSDFKPAVGTKLGIILRSTFGDACDAGVYCEGSVVRVEQVRVGAAPGIAVRFSDQLPARLMSQFVNQYASLDAVQHRLSA